MEFCFAEARCPGRLPNKATGASNFRMKALAFFLLLSVAQPKAAEWDGYFEYFGLEMDEPSLFRLNLLGYKSFYFDRQIRISTPFISLAGDGNSPFSNTFSPSISCLYFPSLFLRMITRESVPAYEIAWLAMTLLNSNYHYAPGGQDNLVRTQGGTGLTLSAFLKNNVDVFPFNSVPWMKLSPGAGVGLLIMNYGAIPTALDFSVGYVQSLENDFTDHWVRDHGVYFKVSFSGD